MRTQKLDLSAPWEVRRSKLAALFAYDEEVTVSAVQDDSLHSGEGAKAVALSVSNHAKAAALKKLAERAFDYGAGFRVVVEDTAEEESMIDTLKAAFAYNPLLRRVESVEDTAGVEWIFAVMEAEPLQCFTDCFPQDCNGNFTALASDVAAELFEVPANTHFCTADLREN